MFCGLFYRILKVHFVGFKNMECKKMHGMNNIKVQFLYHRGTGTAVPFSHINITKMR
jgi:hypothetical protein